MVAATSAAEALTLLEDYASQILLCNIKLPQHNGDWLIQQIRQQEAHTGQFLPAIAVTSYSREFSLQQLQLNGFQGYLNKLSNLEQVVLEVLRLVDTTQPSPDATTEGTEPLIPPLEEGHSPSPLLEP